MTNPNRGEVWTVSLDPTRGHEQAGSRPCLVLSVNEFNHGRAGLVVVLPITSRIRTIPSHVRLPRGEAGLRQDSVVKCEEVRCISKERLATRWGAVAPSTISAVESRVRLILGL